MIDLQHQELELESPAAAEEQEQPETAAASDAAVQEIEEEEKVSENVQKKFDKLTAARRSAERVARDLRTRLDAIERKLEAKPAEQARVEATDPKPDINVWAGTADEYTEALSRWAARQEHKELSAKERKAAEEADRDEQARATVQQFQERVDDFVEEHDDYNDVVATIKMSAEVGPGIQNAIFEDDHGPALAYYLGQHPELQKKLDDMTPARAVAYLGRIAERLFPEDDDTEEVEAEPSLSLSPRPKPVVQAPAPIRPVKKSAPTARPTANGDELSTEEWLKRELAREEKTRRR